MLNPGPQHLLWLLVGPSGVGKSTLEAALTRALPNAQKMVSTTTRKPRLEDGEVHGVHYFFVTPEAFAAAEAAGEFAEVVTFGVNRYGATKAEIEKKLQRGPVIAVVEPNGVRQLKANYGDRAVSIYLDPPYPAAAIERMRRRGTSESDIQARSDDDKRIIEFRDHADHRIVANIPEDTLAKTLQLIDSYKNNVLNQPKIA